MPVDYFIFRKCGKTTDLQYNLKLKSYKRDSI
jgi:hypothetical protein